MTQEMFVAIDSFDVAKVEQLLQEGADPDLLKDTFLRVRPLHAAIVAIEEGGPLKLLDLLIDFGADVNKTYPDVGGGTPVFVAVVNGQHEATRRLLEAGADPNVSSEEGDTPLRWAVEQSDYATAELLIAYGAQQTIDGFSAVEGRTALGMAVNRLDVKMVEILLDAGAKPNARDFDRNTAADCLPILNDKNHREWRKVSIILKNRRKSQI